MNHNQNSQRKKIMSVCMSGIIAALYVALTMLSRAVGLDCRFFPLPPYQG